MLFQKLIFVSCLALHCHAEKPAFGVKGLPSFGGFSAFNAGSAERNMNYFRQPPMRQPPFMTIPWISRMFGAPNGRSSVEPPMTYHRMLQTPDPLAFYEQQKNEYLNRESRDQSAIMAETYLSKFETSCIQRSFCEVASTSRGLEPQESQAARMSVQLIDSMLTGMDAFRKARFPTIQKLVAAYRVGQMTQNATMCKWLFPCVSKDSNEAQARMKCSQASKMCPALSITCAMCGLSGIETCGTVCPVAGFYCGVAGYSCNGKKEDEAQPEDEEEMTTPAPRLPRNVEDSQEAFDDILSEANAKNEETDHANVGEEGVVIME